MCVTVRPGTVADAQACQQIARAQRDALPFVRRAQLQEAARRDSLLVAEREGQLVGFLTFRHRVRDLGTALYDLAVEREHQRQGVGRALVQALIARSAGRTIRLKCPVGLPANLFYAALPFHCAGQEEGRQRALNLWYLEVPHGPS